jgi:SSS family transporter
VILELAAAVLLQERFEWKPSEDRPPPAARDSAQAAAAQDGTVLEIGGDPPTSEAWRTVPGKGRRKAAPAPAPLGAPPALAYGPSHVLVFSDRVLAYHTVTDTWTAMGALPAGFRPAAASREKESILLVDRAGRTLRGEPVARKGSFSPLDYAVISLYLLAMVGIGVRSARGPRDTNRFFLAGGRVPWWAAGLSIFGAQLSAITFLSIPAKAYATDWVYVLHNVAVALVAPIVICFYLGFYCRLKVTSAYEYLERRFNLAVRLFGSATFTVYQLIRMSMQMYLPALLLSTVLGVDLAGCILVIGLTTTLYCMLGGAEAVVWTEVVQGVVLLGSAFLSLGIIMASVDGGLRGILEVGRAEGKFQVFNWTWDMTTTAVWVVLGGSLLQHLVPYTSDQAVVQRYLTTRDERQAARSIWVNNVALTLVATVLFFGLGTSLFVFYKSRPELLDPTLSREDAIFPLFMSQTLPPGLLGLVVAGLLSASMSGGINAIATVLVTDVVRRFRPDRPDRSYLRAAVALTAALGLVATAGGLVLAGLEVRSIWDVFLRILGLFGGSLAGLFALGIFTRRATGAGAAVGALAGAAATFLVQSFTPVHFFLYAGTGILATFGAGYAASLVLPSRPRDLAGLTLYTREAA